MKESWMAYIFHCETCHAEKSLDLLKTEQNVTEVKSADGVLQHIIFCRKCGTRQAESAARVLAKGGERAERDLGVPRSG
jgi:hypothetical protein